MGTLQTTTILRLVLILFNVLLLYAADGTPMAEMYLRGIVQRANGTFIPTAPAVVNGNRFFVLTEFAPDDGEEVGLKCV